MELYGIIWNSMELFEIIWNFSGIIVVLYGNIVETGYSKKKYLNHVNHRIIFGVKPTKRID